MEPAFLGNDAVLTAADVGQAYDRLRRSVRLTPLVRSTFLSEELQCDVYLKLETHQHTGSFKVRGALNAVARAVPNLDVIVATSGNHGLAVAWAMAPFGAVPTVIVPFSTAPAKLQKLRDLGARVEIVEKDAAEAEQEARRRAAERGAVYISPYNDPAVIAGQGTIGLEISRQGPPFDAIFVSVGGGGLIAGIAMWLKACCPPIVVVGCSPAASPALERLVRGEPPIRDIAPTLSDGTAGTVEMDSITVPLCRSLVDHWVTVEEQHIAAAIRDVHAHEGLLIEGSAGLAVAGLRKCAASLKGKRVAVILCGSNISPDRLTSIL